MLNPGRDSEDAKTEGNSLIHADECASSCLIASNHRPGPDGLHGNARFRLQVLF
jgi:hypothetical protein